MDTNTLFDNVLLIEDEAAHILLIRRVLEPIVGELRVVEDVRSALQQLQTWEPDLVITDLHLPDSNGIVHIEQLQALRPGMPLVVLTSSNSLRDAVAAMQLGARDYVVKNFNSDFREVLQLSLSRLKRALELESDRRKFQRELTTLRLAIESASDALAVVDSRGAVQYANRSFEQFAQQCGSSGVTIEQLFSGAVVDHDRLQARLTANLQELTDGAVWSTEVSFASAPESAYEVSLSAIASPVMVEGGLQPDRLVLWARDISASKRREKFQREILSTTTHDLKGPLGTITLSSELLSGMLEKGTRAHDVALRVGSAAQGAINLIDEFLSARRLEEGTFILKPITQDVAALLHDLEDNYGTIAVAHKINLTFVAESGLSACVDAVGFKRVIGNLLSNALKFTSSGGKVAVTARMAQEGLVVSVQDTGYGMEASEVQKIFESFTRLDRHLQIDGTGLGLYIVKNIVSAHGGKVEVTSRVGSGTQFSVLFPSIPPMNDRGELIALDFS